MERGAIPWQDSLGFFDDSLRILEIDLMILWVPMGFFGILWDSLGFLEIDLMILWDSLGFFGILWVSMGFYGIL